MIIQYLGHAGFEFVSRGKTILIDPFFKGTGIKYSGRPDIILVTHEHFDHADDAKGFDCTVVAPATCKFKKQVVMKVGEKKVVDGIPVEMIGASHHQSKYPTGFIFELEGKRIAHLGDTYLDGVTPLPNIDLLLVPIGGFYTMNIDEALEATSRIRPRLVIPMHYGTFEQIKASPLEFAKKAEQKGYKVRVLNLCEKMEF